MNWKMNSNNIIKINHIQYRIRRVEEIKKCYNHRKERFLENIRIVYKIGG